MPTPIGLCGLAGAGKDTAFAFINEWADERGVSARRRSFADALKLSFARMFIPDCSVDEAVNWCNELKFTGTVEIFWSNAEDAVAEGHGTVTTVKHTISGRTALQRYGTEGHRDVFGDDFWVDVLYPVEFLNKAAILDGNPPEYRYPLNFVHPLDPGPPEICVAADTRFENEAKRIRSLNGYVLEIVRPTKAKLSDGEWKHRSESGLPHELIDHTFVNDGSLEDFRDLVREWCDDTLGSTYPPATTFDS